MLKKMIIVAAAAAVAMAGGIGIASAHEAGHAGTANANCKQSNNTTQKNHGDSLVGNLDVQDITANVLGIQATKPSGEICPTVLSGNHL